MALATLTGLVVACGGAAAYGVAAAPAGAAVADAPVTAKVLVVAPDGNDGNAGTVAAPLHTIQVAVSRLPAVGGIVELRGGDYQQRVHFTGVGDITLAPVQARASRARRHRPSRRRPGPRR